MHPTKAPGPDGCHTLIFQKFWDIVGSEVIGVVKSWWTGNLDLQHINKTYFFLIPKLHDPKDLNDFHPIYCCNVIYKVISKVLANRLKPFLDSIISITQSAFILTQMITDNALVAFDTFHAMKRYKG